MSGATESVERAAFVMQQAWRIRNRHGFRSRGQFKGQFWERFYDDKWIDRLLQRRSWQEPEPNYVRNGDRLDWTTDGRNALIFASIEAGDQTDSVASYWGLTRARVSQIAREEREKREKLRRSLFKSDGRGRVEVFVSKDEMKAAWKRRYVSDGYYHNFNATYSVRYLV